MERLRPDVRNAVWLGAILMVVMTRIPAFHRDGGGISLLADGTPTSGVSRDGLAIAVAIALSSYLVIGLGSAVFDQKDSSAGGRVDGLIRASEARFRAIFDHAALGITVIDSSTPA